jgi:MYXO-CTERM domain-containing protein
MSERRPLSRRPLLAALAALPLAVPAVSAAKGKGKGGGTVTVNTKQITESGGGWKVMLTIKLPQKPAIPHQTFRFVFAPVAIYETYLDDSSPNEKTRVIPQAKDVQPNVETMDVGFSDARGDVFDTTKFDFTIRRDRNFFAGEYQLEVYDGDGNRLGQTVTLKLEGKNDVVDRRTMMLEGNAGAKKKPAAASSAAPAAPPPPGNEAAAPPLEGAVPRPEDMGSDPPPSVDKKSGGCGCSVPGSASTPVAWPALLAGAAALGLTRRGRRGQKPRAS